MPRGDGTGPMGMGPMAEWGRGYCRPRGRRMGFSGRGYAAGYAAGPYGPGRGYGRPGPWGAYDMGPEEEKAILEEEKTYLKSRLDEIEDRLKKWNNEE